MASLVIQLALMPQEEGGIVQSHHTCSISEAHQIFSNSQVDALLSHLAGIM